MREQNFVNFVNQNCAFFGSCLTSKHLTIFFQLVLREHLLNARPWGLFQHKAHSREPSREDLWLQGVGTAEGEVTWCRQDPGRRGGAERKVQQGDGGGGG